jgi:hypothetical protein
MTDSTAKKGGRMGKVLNYGGKSILVLALVLLVADIVWTSSGSNQWNVVSDKDGIRVATMKTPGYSLFKYKVDMHVDNKLSDIVFYMSDLNTGYDVGASDIRRIEQVSSAPLFYAYDTYKLDLKPFGKLDVLILNEYIQDPKTKKVSINVNAAPNKEPVNPNVMRIVHLSNNFTLTPVATGGVDIELISEMDLGLPYVLTNLAMPSVIPEEFGKMREMLKKDRYKNGKPAFITELDENPKVANAAH